MQDTETLMIRYKNSQQSQERFYTSDKIAVQNKNLQDTEKSLRRNRSSQQSSERYYSSDKRKHYKTIQDMEKSV